MINVAYAATSASAGGDSGFMMILLTAIVVMLYFTVIRPQQRQAKEHEQLIKNLQEGDEIITNGGIFGQIEKIEDGILKVNIAEGLVIKIQRAAVSRLLPKGSLTQKAVAKD